MENENPYGNDKYIRVMPDYMSNCIWHRDGMHAEPDELPVSQQLLARLASMG